MLEVETFNKNVIETKDYLSLKRLVVIVFLLAFTISLFGSSVDDRLTKIPPNDREKIDLFLDYAVKIDHVGHVLYFENKPAALISFCVNDDAYEDCTGGWHTFKKYLNVFPSKKFLLNESVKDFSDRQLIFVFLINRFVFLNCINENQLLFEKVLGRDFDGKVMLKELENGRSLFDLIENNDLLLGVLLGYGVESATLFAQMQSAEDPTSLPDGSYISYPQEEILEEVEILPIGFKGSIHSKEAKKINAKFKEEWISLNQILKEKNRNPTRFFLEPYCGE